MDQIHDAARLKELQALSLDRKIMITQTRIIDWYEHFGGKVYVSFSGGKDSTVLLDLARRAYPDMKAVFVNTGLEYPEIRKFALGFDNVEELRPVWGRAGKKRGKAADAVITFYDTLYYGYPLISKAVANAITRSRKNPEGSRWIRLHGQYKRLDGARSQFDYSKYLPLYHLPVRISDECCLVNKKGPDRIYQRKTKSHPIVATMTEEAIIRQQAWIVTGCNAFDSAKPISKPLSFWTNQDVLTYISRFGIDICSVYGDIVFQDEDGQEYDAGDAYQIFGAPCKKLKCTGCERTGCVYCAFGVHLEKGQTRFQRLAVTHPHLYEHCIGGGEWRDNSDYDPTITDPNRWNPKKLWGPSNKGLGMGVVFDMVNDIYGKDFIRYE